MIVTNALLVLVTAAYVLLTLRISKSSADAAHTAASVAMATVDATFEVKLALRRLVNDPDPNSRSDYFNLGVRIRPSGSNLLVHEVRLVNYMRATQPEATGKRTEAEGPSREVLEWGTDLTPPVRLHRDQSRRFYSPAVWIPKGYVQRIDVEIDYSLDEHTISTYRAHWIAPTYEFFAAGSMRIERSFSGTHSWAEVQDPADPD